MATEPKLVSMKRSAADKRKDAGEAAPMTSIAPDYPYGLVIHLDKDEMDKLKMAMPKPGDVVTIEAQVKCTACRISEPPGMALSLGRKRLITCSEETLRTFCGLSATFSEAVLMVPRPPAEATTVSTAGSALTALANCFVS